MSNNIQILSPFGPKIGKLKIPIKLISTINKKVDQIAKDKNLSKKFDYSQNLV